MKICSKCKRIVIDEELIGVDFKIKPKFMDRFSRLPVLKEYETKLMCFYCVEKHNLTVQKEQSKKRFFFF